MVGGGNAVGQAHGYGCLPPVHLRLGGAHAFGANAPVLGNGVHKHGVKPVDFGLHVGAHVLWQRFVGVAVHLVAPSKDVGDADAVVIECARKVHMAHDHANAADVARAGHGQMLKRGSTQVSGRRCHAVGNGPHGLAAAQGVHALGVFKGARDFAAGAVPHLQDGVDIRVCLRGFDLDGQFVVAQQVAGYAIHAAAVYQRAAGVDDSHTVGDGVACIAALAPAGAEHFGGDASAVCHGIEVYGAAQQAPAHPGDDGV